MFKRKTDDQGGEFHQDRRRWGKRNEGMALPAANDSKNHLTCLANKGGSVIDIQGLLDRYLLSKMGTELRRWDPGSTEVVPV